jgi:hypothetical protein
MNTSPEIAKISAALVLAQKDMLPLIKDSDNPFFKSKYADLHAVTQACYPALQANDICVMQSAESLGATGINIITRLIHSSGEFIETECAIPPAGQDPQKYGSAVTYGRRYGLQAAVGLAATDDDAEAAMGRRDTNDHGKTEPQAKSKDDGMVDKIIESFKAQTTPEGLDAKMEKAKTTPYAKNPNVLLAYEECMQTLTK